MLLDQMEEQAVWQKTACLLERTHNAPWQGVVQKFQATVDLTHKEHKSQSQI
jgi:hypothetical protein